MLPVGDRLGVVIFVNCGHPKRENLDRRRPGYVNLLLDFSC
jgi:hypothetical protein